MNLTVNRTSDIPIYVQISAGIKRLIQEHELTDGYKLPSERQLAAELGVHRNTVVKAYFELISDGWIISSRSKPRGYFVRTKRTEDLRRKFFPLEQNIQYEFDGAVNRIMDVFFSGDNEDLISFGGMILAPKVAYLPGLEQVVGTVFRSEDGRNLKKYQEELNRVKANIQRLLTKRNLYVPMKNIQVVSECNEAISYLMDLYVKEGECILAEEPMAADLAGLIQNKGIRVITIPVEEDGVNLKRLEMAIQRYKPKFFYTMPNGHNPTAVTMSYEKRRSLLEITHRYDLLVIEDDWPRWLGYSEEQIPSLYMLDQNKSVVYLDSLTLFFPYGIKIGYIIGPTELVEMLGRILAISDTVPGDVGHYFVNTYLENEYFDRYIEQLKSYCREKRDLMCRELDKLRRKGITYRRPKGGILVWCRLPDDIEAESFFDAAAGKGVRLMLGKFFYHGDKTTERYFRLCFSNVTDDEIRRGVALLGDAVEDVRTAKRSRNES